MIPFLKLNTTLFTAIALTLVMSRCAKEDDKLKTAKIDTYAGISSNAAMQGRVIITEAVMNIAKFEIKGTTLSKNTERSTKELVEAEQAFLLTNRATTPSIVLEGKPADYDPISFRITTTPDPYQLTFVTVDGATAPDYSSFRTNAKPALMLRGKFDTRGSSVPFLIAINDIFPLEIIATQNGNTAVTLGSENRADLNLNPAFLFEDISSSEMENAERVVAGNESIIFIHAEFNSGLYQKILRQIETPEKSFSLQVVVTSGQD